VYAPHSYFVRCAVLDHGAKVVEHHRISGYLKALESGGDHTLLFAHELVMGNDTPFKWMKKIGKAKSNVRNGTTR